MDGPIYDLCKSRAEGFITRTRINTQTDDSLDKIALGSGANIVTFDQKYNQTWSLLENDPRCEILDGKTFGKVCKWTANSVYLCTELCKYILFEFYNKLYANKTEYSRICFAYPFKLPCFGYNRKSVFTIWLSTPVQ